MNTMRLRLLIALLVALILTILPLPDMLCGIRPPWALMLALYLQFFLSDYFNVTLLFIMGLALDVLLSTVLGQHAFALSFVAWIASTKARRFRLFSMSQQMVLVGVFCVCYQVVILLIDASFGYQISLTASLGSTLISILLWPWVRLVADDKLLARAIYQQ